MTDFLKGKLLIAMPGMLDDMFAETTVLLCLHSEDGAMGFIINKPADSVSFEDLVSEIVWGAYDDDDPSEAARPVPQRDCRVHVGGPVEPSRGFVLHSPDFFTEGASVRISDGLCLSATVDILKALAEGHGPKNALLALGYAAWSPGQLEREIQANGWLHTDVTTDLVFKTPVADRYEQALAQLGIDRSFLVTEAGHA